MNKTQLFACVAGVLVGASAFAQGQFSFSTTAKTPINLQGSKILDPNGVAIAGANYLIDVLVKQTDGSFSQASVLKVTTTSGNIPLTPVSPLTGAGAGLFSGGAILIGNILPGAAATLKVIAWDVTTGATYDLATTKGSQTFVIDALGGVGSPPTSPVQMANFTGFTLTAIPTPEPSTYALAALGLGGLLLFRRK